MENNAQQITDGTFTLADLRSLQMECIEQLKNLHGLITYQTTLLTVPAIYNVQPATTAPNIERLRKIHQAIRNYFDVSATLAAIQAEISRRD